MTVANQSHELYVWDADDLVNELQRMKDGIRTGLEYNERLKQHIDADAVAVAQLLKSGTQISRQINLLGASGRAYIKEARGKRYIIFKGSAALRPNLKGTRYLADNSKVRCFVVGSKDIFEDAMKGTKIAIIAFIAIDVITEVTSDQPSLASLGVHLTSDVVQTVASAAMGWAAGAAILAVSPAAPVVIVFIAVVMVGFVAGMGLAYLDTHFRLTERARAHDVVRAKYHQPMACCSSTNGGSRAPYYPSRQRCR